MNSRVEPVALNFDETMAALGICRRHLANLVRSGEIPSCKLGRRRVFPVEQLRECLAKRSAQATNPKEVAHAA